MNETPIIQPEAFPAELVKEDPSTDFETDELESELEEDFETELEGEFEDELEAEARRGARSRFPATRFRDSGGRSRGSRPRVRAQPGQQRKPSRKPLPPRFPRRPRLGGRRSVFDGQAGAAVTASDTGERARWLQDCLNHVRSEEHT